MTTVNFYNMKRLKFKTTSKKLNFEVFNKLSITNLSKVKGGNTETPPDEVEQGTSNS